MKTKFFKRALSGVLSAACILSGTAFAGMTVLNADEPIEAKAVSPSQPEFSWDNATVYFLLTDRFKNGDTSNDNAYNRKAFNGDNRASFHGGDFAGITQEIEAGYFDNLGVNAIWLTAPYEQIHGYIQGGSDFGHYSYHGYYVLDYTETDAAYGTKEEFQTLVDTAHEHGIRIVMDIVMNHAGYNSMYDMNEYGYGTLKSGWEDAYNSENLAEYHDYIDYTNSDDSWSKWWGYNWIRCGINGFVEPGGDDMTRCLAALPDFVTESTAQVGIPPLLQTKWQKEGTLAAKKSKYGTSDTVTGFITSWLADWVREYGVDGFRCDTAKHVDLASWNKLKTKCTAALKEWKQKNPTKKLDDLDFWMTGECWDWNIGAGKDGYFTQGGFDSMINFQTQGGGMVSQGMVANTYANYANSINKVDGFNGLSYVSSHDSTLARPSDMYALGSAFLLLPGAVQIYYGDETARPYVEGIPRDGNGGAGHSLRSDMPWSSLNTDLVNHWGTVGRFRANHLSVGAGSNTALTASSGVGFGRTYDKNGTSDKIAGVVYASNNTSVSIDVSALWSNGTQLHNYYDDTYATVSGGKVTFNSGAHGTILIEEPSGPRGVVKVKHIDKDKGTTIKEETLSGAIGDSYTTSALTLDGYTVASTSGETSGTYTEADISVTYYYTFDSANYGIIVTKHVDTDSGAELAEQTTQTKKVGTSYSTSAASIKNYELDTTPSNATGTVKTGTTTVTYKYVYVEPTTVRVHYYNSNSWSPVYMYSYDDRSGTVKKFNGNWPGAQMTAETGGWYVCDADNEWALVLFNAGKNGPQEPSAGAKGYECDGEVWIKDAKVYPTGKVNVKYVSTDGKTLATETLKGMADGSNSYTTTAKTFDGYELSSTPSNATGKYTEETTTVVYTYKSTSSTVNPTGVTLNKTSLSLEIGGTSTLTATVAPSNATDKTVTWKSNKTSVATVSSSGKVTAVAEGTATITATTVNNKTATCTVTVTSPSSTLKNNSTIVATKAQVGDDVRLDGVASGGSGSYKYAFYFKRSVNSKWNKIGTEYGTKTHGTLVPTVAADYDLKVIVKDSKGATAEKTFKVTVVNSMALTNVSQINTGKSVSVNQTVTIRGRAVGGGRPVSYEFFFKRSSNSKWNTVSYGGVSGTFAKFTPTAATSYDLKCIVTDANGTTSQKVITITAS